MKPPCRLAAEPAAARWPSVRLLALLAAGVLGAAGAFASSTGTSDLITIQGGGALRSQGDFVSAASPSGLDTYYSVFFEAPPSLSRLDVDLFDADIGDDGSGEAAEGRDRARSGFNTDAEYVLLAPNGSQVSTRFAAGNASTPAGGDNAWLTLFSSTSTFRDEFTSASYANNHGTNAWATNWTETGEGTNPTGGDIQIVSDGGNNRLRVQDNNLSVQREANLNGVTSATLSFSYRRNDLDGTTDYVAIEVSANGGGSWTELDRFQGPADDGGYSAESYDLTPYIATNTRIRFLSSSGLGGNDQVYFDNVEISTSGAVAGHWELRIDQSDDGGSDINALGIRAHDGDSSSGGTEIPGYFHSYGTYGTNGPPATRTYEHYPYVTSGCLLEQNNFDWDSNSDATGSLSLDSRTGVFTQSVGTLSGNDAWQNTNIGPWTDDQDSTDYGVWSMDVTINDYPGNANYGQVYLGNFSAASPPTAQPQANTFRIYLPTDAGAAPVKPYLEQLVRHSCANGSSGPNPPVVGQTSCFTVTVRLVNPAPDAITFSTPSNIVTANIPGGGAVYGGVVAVGQGTVVSEPSVGGTGNITWNPGTLAAGATTVLAYRVNVTPTSAGQRIPVTATPVSGNGTRAQFLDETGNTSQARATYLAGPACELAVTVDLLTPAVVSSFRAAPSPSGGVVVEWTTAAEVGTAGFRLLRRQASRGGRWEPVHDGVIAAMPGADQGATYSFHDGGAWANTPHVYLLEEVTPRGRGRRFGPYRVDPRQAREVVPEPEAAFSVVPHAALAPPAERTERLALAPRVNAAKGGERTDTVRIAVAEAGLVRLPLADLVSAFGQPEKKVEQRLDKGKLSLTHDGATAHWRAERGANGAVTALLFNAELPDSLYTREAVYRLELENGGAQMTTQAVGASAAPPASSLDAFTRQEVDAFAATAIAPPPEADYWFWEFLVAGDPTVGTRTFDLPVAAALSEAGLLEVALHGASDSGTPGEHEVSVALNGHVLGQVSWEGITARNASFAVAPGQLRPAGDPLGNEVTLVAGVGGGAPFSIVYLDSLALAYRRDPVAVDDLVVFTGEGLPVSIGGFSGQPIALLDVTDALRPRWLEGAVVEQDGAGFRLRFDAQDGRRYLASGPGAAVGGSLRAWKGLRRSAAEYLVIAPPELLDAAEGLASLREGHGLSARTIDVEAIGDTYGHGVTSPQAIRSFLGATWSASRGRLRYAALAGRGTLDYRNLLPVGGVPYGDNLVPPLMVRTEDGLFP
jgi:hypothetical protein